MQYVQAARVVLRFPDTMIGDYFQWKLQQPGALLQQVAISDDDQPARQLKLCNLHAQVWTNSCGLSGGENECQGGYELRRRHGRDKEKIF